MEKLVIKVVKEHKRHEKALEKICKKANKKMQKLLNKLRKSAWQKGGTTMQEMLAKARAKLSSLQMQDVYDAMEKNGDVTGVAYCYKKVVVTYKNGAKGVFQMWE